MKKLKAIGECVLYFAIFSLTPVVCFFIFALLNLLLDITKTNIKMSSGFLWKIFSCILIIIICYLISKRKQINFVKEIKFNKIPIISMILLLLLGISVVISFAFVLDNISNIFPALRKFAESNSSETEIPTGALEKTFMFIAVCIFVPITEEIIFRSYIFSTLEKAFPKIIAYILVVTIFAVLHGDLLTIISVLVNGGLLIWVFERYNSVVANALVHAGMNLIITIVNMVTLDSDKIATFIGVSSVFVFVISIICIYINTKNVQIRGETQKV